MGSIALPHSTSLPTNQPCPECQSVLPVDPQYITWCDQCGWNIHPDNIAKPCNLFEQLYLAQGYKQSKRLFDSMTTATKRQSGTSLSKVVAIGIAVVVHLLSIMFAVSGGWLLLRADLNPFLLLLAVLCLGLAWIACPRFNKEPEHVVSPTQFPVLYRVTNQIAQELGFRRVTKIIIDHEFNASFHQVGWRQQPVVTIGLPLFAILTPQERVAILAHELAHGVNGDPRRSFFLGAAVRSLLQWHQLFRPDHLQLATDRYATGAIGGFLVFASHSLANVIMYSLSRVPWLGAYLLSHLIWRDSQRAEYYADWLAATVSGTEAALTALEKLHYANVFERTVHQVAMQPGAKPSLCPGGFVEALRRNVATLPARELDRIRRVETLLTARLDATHPPTPYRLQFLKSRTIVEGSVLLFGADAVALECELLSTEQRITRELIDQHRGQLYY